MEYKETETSISVRLNKNDLIDLVLDRTGKRGKILYGASKAPEHIELVLMKELVPRRFKSNEHMLKKARTELLFEVLQDFKRRMNADVSEAKTAGVFSKAIMLASIFDNASTLEDLLAMPSGTLLKIPGLGEKRIGLFQRYLEARGYRFIEQ